MPALGDVLEQNHDANEGSHVKSGGGKFKARCTLLYTQTYLSDKNCKELNTQTHKQKLGKSE